MCMYVVCDVWDIQKIIFSQKRDKIDKKQGQIYNQHKKLHIVNIYIRKNFQDEKPRPELFEE